MECCVQVLYTADTSVSVQSSIFDDGLLDDDDDCTLATYMSPYQQQSNGNWTIETSSGRLINRALTLTAVKASSADYLLLHLFHYEANSTYRDLFIR